MFVLPAIADIMATTCVKSHMRQVIYGGAVSLDGFLAGPGERIDWLRHSDESAKLIAESFVGVDAILMGRKTFESAQRMGGGPPMKGVATYVFSRTIVSLPKGAVGRLVTDDAAGFVSGIKSKEGGKILVMGGGELGSALIAAGLVDEIRFSIHPVLLGGGVPAFRPLENRVDLALVEARAITPQCVLVRYNVLNDPIA
jgi:dihydrofolate reductase